MTYTVMIAEDEPLILDSLRRNIEQCGLGFTVVGTARNGAEILSLLERQVPHVLFTDIQMPELNGLHLLQRIEADYPDVQKIVVSGYDEFDYAREAFRARAQDYLLKPVLLDDIRRTLLKTRQVLDEKSSALNDARLARRKQSYPIADVVRILERHIKDHFAEETDLDLSMDRFPYSRAYISRVFSATVGFSPSKYRIHLRMNRARHLLTGHPEMTVTEIAASVGYENTGYFCRLFKSMYGQTARQFRDSAPPDARRMPEAP